MGKYLFEELQILLYVFSKKFGKKRKMLNISVLIMYTIEVQSLILASQK